MILGHIPQLSKVLTELYDHLTRDMRRMKIKINVICRLPLKKCHHKTHKKKFYMYFSRRTFSFLFRDLERRLNLRSILTHLDNLLSLVEYSPCSLSAMYNVRYSLLLIHHFCLSKFKTCVLSSLCVTIMLFWLD